MFDELKTNTVGFIQLHGIFSPRTFSLLQSNVNELDKTSDYISVYFNDMNLCSLVTPVNHKGESQLFYLIFLLFFIEHMDCSTVPNLLRIFQSEITASKHAKATANDQSRSTWDLHFMTLHRNRIWLSKLLSQIDMKKQQSSKMYLIDMTPLLIPPSSIHSFPFSQDPASVLISLPM